MRGAWWIIGLCLGLSLIAGVALRNRYHAELVEVQDLLTGVLYFMEDHAGRFPASEEEFRASRWVRQLPDGGLQIAPRADSRYRRETHGVVLRDLPRFKLAWGADLSTFTLNERGRVLNPDGREVVLLAWPSSPPSGREYAKVIFAAHRALAASPADVSGAAASAPATHPAISETRP